MLDLRAVVVGLAVSAVAAPAWAAGGVKGKVVFDGKAPAAEKVRMSADPKCLQAHPKGLEFSPARLSSAGGVADSFVYVKKGLEGKTFPTPQQPKTVLDQKGCWYAPRVVGVMVGQTLEILNSDPTMHNVNASGEFNSAMPANVKKIERVFKAPKVMVRVKCNIHPWMTAYVGVVEHPFFATTAADGSFELKGLPPGKYVVEAWHERLGAVEQEVTVGAKPAAVALKLPGKGKG